MKLPNKDAVQADIESGLVREIVLQTLRDNGVSVEQIDSHLFELSKGDALWVQAFDDFIGGLMIKRLAKVFDIERLDFYYDPNTRESKKKRLFN